jgi:DNA-binding transcriptional LysR family regulator
MCRRGAAQKMSKLENIQVLIRAVELGSFSAAGRSMRLSAAVVSHRIRSLESQLGCRLFNRTTRKMQLTEQGRVFYENCLEVTRALDRAEASVSETGARPRGMLKVTAPLGFGRDVVAPMLPKFQLQNPETDVFLRLSDYLIDLFSEAVDVAVRIAVLPDSSLVVRKIADIERTLCASPAYLERYGTPRSISDLQEHRCLLLRYPGSQQFKWTLQNGLGGEQDSHIAVPVTGHLDADAGDALTQWALLGEGIAMKPVFEIAAHLKSGALVQIMRNHRPVPATLAILHAYQRMVPLKVRTFADILVEDARAYISSELAGVDPVKRSGRRLGK